MRTRLAKSVLWMAFGCAVCFPTIAKATPQPAIAMLGSPKYASDFTHFDYADPHAPKGGQLRLGVVGSFDSFNPFIVQGRAPVAPAFGLDRTGSIYESLMARSFDEPFSLYGLIAETIDVPDDRSSATFSINPLARWSDGAAITADDVIFSYETLRDKGRPNHRTYYRKVAQVERLSPRRVRFTFKPDKITQPDGTTVGRIDREMPLIMGLMPVLPRHDWYFRDFNLTTLRIPLGSGPYRIARFEPGRAILLQRDPNYWGRDLPTQRGLYNFDQVRIDYYRDENIALQAFKAGAFDLRREMDPKKWATAYDTPAVARGDIVKIRFSHERTESAAGFALNTRRDIFKNPALREAVFYAFDFGWVNKALFHSLTKRTTSFFPNSNLACNTRQAPDENERAAFKEALNSPVFKTEKTPVLPGVFDIPTTDGAPESFRANLLKAQNILRKAGYDWQGGVLYEPLHGTPVRFEILIADPTEEKIALSWSRGLRRLGIDAPVRVVDSAQFQARLNNFEYDAVSARWYNSLSPGNEQIFYWGTRAADQKGSRNYPGVRDPLIDALAARIPTVRTRDELIGTARALDRALLAGHYVVPLYYLGADQIAYWKTRLVQPSQPSAYGAYLEAWSARPSPTPTPSPVSSSAPLPPAEFGKVPDLSHIIPDPRPFVPPEHK